MLYFPHQVEAASSNRELFKKKENKKDTEIEIC